MILIQTELHCEQISPTAPEYSFGGARQANFQYRLAAEGEKATQTLCFLVACVEMSEINRTAPAGNDSFDVRRRLNVRRLFMMPCSSRRLLSFFWT